MTAKNIWLDDSKSEQNEFTAKITDFEKAHELGDSEIVEILGDEGTKVLMSFSRF